MKSLIILFFALFTVHSLAAPGTENQVEKKSAVVDNLIVGIKSDNTGLHSSSAIVLAELINHSYLQGSDASKAMIPLLKMLDNGKTDEERIAAAVSLYQLGNPIGIYRLRGVAIFDNNEKVAEICKNLYRSYHILHGTEFLSDF